jgi:hypothetical protein
LAREAIRRLYKERAAKQRTFAGWLVIEHGKGWVVWVGEATCANPATFIVLLEARPTSIAANIRAKPARRLRTRAKVVAGHGRGVVAELSTQAFINEETKTWCNTAATEFFKNAHIFRSTLNERRNALGSQLRLARYGLVGKRHKQPAIFIEWPVGCFAHLYTVHWWRLRVGVTAHPIQH